MGHLNTQHKAQDSMTLDQYTAVIEKNFPFHELLGIKLDAVQDDCVRLRVPYNEKLLGHVQSRMIHGGVISSLIDISGGFAVWTKCAPEDTLVTITLSVDYLRPAMACDLIAEATVRLQGNRVGNAHVVVWPAGAPDVHLAVGRGVYNIKRA